MTDLRYPIGKYVKITSLTADERKSHIAIIAETPALFRTALRGLTEEQLDTPYRPGGWTVRQVAHHIADSHMNAYIRLKLAVTEDVPTVKPYDEKLWAELPDARSAPVGESLALLEGLHARWTVLLHTLTPEQFTRTYNHPENGLMTLDSLLGLYSWHGRHHTAHVTSLRLRMGW